MAEPDTRDSTAQAEPDGRIRVLPPELADQIAAGEVVERPASVVKELCENSIDAGARRIDVDIEAGGRRLVRVVDDGAGMSAADARLALKRHATSKIVRAEDLWGLRTFGFRGEALPSIAAVSRLALQSKTAGAEAGVRLAVEAGIETEAREVGMPGGTQVEVRDLFFNTPARLKFQKSDATETANVSEAILRLALGHPGVHFRLRVAGRTTLDLPPHRDLAERVRAALARRGAGALHEADGREGPYQVRAFLASPEEATTTTRSTFLMVGGRFVRDRSLLHALCLGYGELLERGRYPLAALFLEMPGEELDVNVHPQKLEVRFANGQEVCAAVRHVVATAIARAPWLAPPPADSMRVYTLPPPSAPAGASRASDGGPGAPAPSSSGAPQRLLPLHPPRPSASGGATPAPLHPVAAPGEATAGVPASEPAAGGFFASLEYLGQLHRTYLVCQGPGELVLVDQHAAHERVVFQRLRTAHGSRDARQQRLLFPVTVDVRGLDAAGSADPLFAALGFELERFGEDALLVRAVPELLKDADPAELLRDALGQLHEGEGARSAEEHIDHVLATMACHSVVRAGDPLGRDQALALLRQLDGVDLRSHCPHGRPVLLRMSLGELERRFGRA